MPPVGMTDHRQGLTPLQSTPPVNEPVEVAPQSGKSHRYVVLIDV